MFGNVKNCQKLEIYKMRFEEINDSKIPEDDKKKLKKFINDKMKGINKIGL